MQVRTVKAIQHHRSYGGKVKGYGWPATMELLSPPSGKSVDSRRIIEMIICPSCNSVHELGGVCIPRHRHPRTPANSTTASVKDFWNYYKNNDSMLKDQFNPFMRESIPPLLVEAYAESHDNWGWCSAWGVPYPCVTRSWTVVRARMLDVAPYAVTVRVTDNGAMRTFSGIGDQWFTADMDIDFWGDYLLDFVVRAEARDTAGNALEIQSKAQGKLVTKRQISPDRHTEDYVGGAWHAVYVSGNPFGL